MGWFDNHCHVDDERIPGGTAGALAAAREAGVTGFVTVGTDAEHSAAAIAVWRRTTTWATVGCTPHAVNARRDDRPAARCRSGRRGGRVRPRLPLRPLASRQRRRSRRRSPRARARAAARHPHPRGWDDTFAVLRPKACPGTPSSTASPRGRGPSRPRRRWRSRRSGIVTFLSATTSERPPCCARRTGSSSRRTRPTSLCPHRGQRNQPAFVPFVGCADGRGTGVNVSQIEHDTEVNARVVFRLTQSSVLAAAGGTRPSARFDEPQLSSPRKAPRKRRQRIPTSVLIGTR